MPLRLPQTRRHRMWFSMGCGLLAVGAISLIWAGCDRQNGTVNNKTTSGPVTLGAAPAIAAAATQADLEGRFQASVHPFLQTYCVSCHSGESPKGDFDISVYSSTDKVVKDSHRWAMVLEKLKAGEMPPARVKDQPAAEARQQVIAWIQGVSAFEAQKMPGDPGTVLAHRLSNAEYNYTIRDLTGVDIQPAKEFPVDPANQAGFDNSGESLSMEPELLKKYMEAARLVSDYLVLKNDGITFAPHPAISDTDRDKYCVNAIMAFYNRQPTDLAEYFLTAWRYENRAALGKTQATLNDFAAKYKISEKYLPTVWSALTDQQEKNGPIAALQAMWKNLPSPSDAKQEEAARQGCAAMRDWVFSIRQRVRPGFENLALRGLQAGSGPFVYWKNRQFADTRLAYVPGSALNLQPEDLAVGTPGAAAMAIPVDEPAQAQYQDAFKRFCAIFPDVFVVTERAPLYLAPNSAEARLKGRYLNAGLHSQTGYFRDDTPLYELILSAQQQQELDSLWHDLDFVADAAAREFQSMIWFERSDSSFMKTREFDFVRTEDSDLRMEPKLKKFQEVFVGKAREATTDEVAVQALVDYFDHMNATFRWMDKARVTSEPTHLAQMQDFAQRAYRRPLSQKERDDIAAFYHSLRTENGLSHEDAIRDTLVSILMSPYFCYRFNAAPPGDGIAPLADYELASRLSYFLWSSMPDRELLDHAAAGDLHKPEVAQAQAQRMMQDNRIRGLATEFGGNWLDFRRFEEHNGVDRERFTTFDNNLREAMFEEPIRFFTNIVRSDQSVLDFLYGDYTFVNPQLAKHYGMPVVDGPADQWMRVDDAHLYQRGGLLPMAVFLTKNAPGLRTSPVKRGYWVVRRVLGEEIPPPPPNVPALPTDESKLGDLTLPQMLAAHRQDPNCATCHIHFDSMGLVFEGYGPIGELRTVDMGGKPVENHATFPSGGEGTGLDGLRTYLRDQRQNDFLNNLCRKLLADALGRTLLLSDEPTVQQMRDKLQSNGYRFSNLVETIVTSPQFLNKRGQGTLAKG